MRTDCGCGCGGTSARPSAFVRPRFFAGQLLTEDDLGLLVDYVTGKTRLHNRTVYGPGVVCGLEVSCDPCGGGKVVVGPGHALDCAGHDIVVSCREQVDVQALVQELRISSLGVDCKDPCEDDGNRRYGLFVRYEELSVEPVAPYATEEPCPSPGCVPSRIREAVKFVVKCGEFDDHRYNPATRLLGALGDPQKSGLIRTRAQRFGFYADAMAAAALGADRAFGFDPTDAKRFTDSLDWLNNSGTDTPPTEAAVELIEHVRALASAVARFDTHDQTGQDRLKREFSALSRVKEARGALATACDRLAKIDPDKVWPGKPLHHSIARAVVTETRARLVPEQGDPTAPLEVRMLAQGTPLSHAVQVEFRSDLSQIREWLLVRLERTPGLADCGLRTEIARTNVPQLLPPPDPNSVEKISLADLQQIAEAASRLTLALTRLLTDAACSTLNPPCSDCTDTDVLLAQVELDGCDVTRICAATREQVLPGGAAYGEWLPKLYRLRELADRLCCKPVAVYNRPALPDGDVVRPYQEKLLGEWVRTGDLEEMLNLLLTRAPGETLPKPLHEQVYTTPSEVTDSLQELSMLRSQVSALTAALEGLRAQLGSAQEQLGSRLEELESTPQQPEPEPARPAPRRPRSGGRTQKSGEST
jgi:hypothetical protein